MNEDFVIKERGSWHFVAKLAPFKLTDGVTDAMRFSYNEAKRTLYLYGLDYNFELYAL